MNPADLLVLKQSLNKAYSLVKPSLAAGEAFKAQLVPLLCQVKGQEIPEQAALYLELILQDTFLDARYLEGPSNSSPVCFSQVNGLREGFADPFLPEQPTAEPAAGRSQSQRLQLNAELKQALLAVKFAVGLILQDWAANLNAAPAGLEAGIDGLVYGLYELSAEDIKLVPLRP